MINIKVNGIPLEEVSAIEDICRREDQIVITIECTPESEAESNNFAKLIVPMLDTPILDLSLATTTEKGAFVRRFSQTDRYVSKTA